MVEDKFWDEVPTGDDTVGLSGYTFEEIHAFYHWLREVDTNTGLAIEVLDCVISELRKGNSLGVGMSVASCEWDV